MSTTNPLLTPNEVARLTGLSEQTLRNWRWKKRGPAFCKIGRGGRCRYRREDVEAWLASYRSNPEATGA